MFLICNSGAIRTDQYADLSQTDCTMLCFGPNTSAHQRSINHQPLLLSGPDIRKISSPVDFYHGTRSTLYVLMLFSFFSPSVFFLNTHTYTRAKNRNYLTKLIKKERNVWIKTSDILILSKWGSLTSSPGPLYMDIVYFCSVPRDEQKSHLELRNVIYFPINAPINKAIHNSFPETGEVEMRLTPCPVSISLLLTRSHKASIVDQPSI